MTKKNWVLILVLLVLAGSYVCFFTTWFRPQTIEIFHVSRGSRPAANAKTPPPKTIPVTFGLARTERLTMLKVVPLSSLETNKFPQPVWHLVSVSNSVPLKSFIYGQNIGGMKAAIAGSRAVPLEPGVTYRLFVEAGAIKGEHDFVPKPAN
jgi:hypothetical protein